MSQHTYTQEEVIKLLECIQWLALSKKSRLFSESITFKQHAIELLTLFQSSLSYKTLIDNFIDYATK